MTHDITNLPTTSEAINDQQQSSRQWHVTAIEWLSHKAVIEAETAEQAEALARQLWTDKCEQEEFRFSDSGLDGFVVDAIDDAPAEDDGRTQP